MNLFEFGIIMGRVVASYLIVLAILLLFNRFNVKLALRKSMKWYSLVATILIFVLGVAASYSKTGAI